jgi:hypothetical protein
VLSLKTNTPDYALISIHKPEGPNATTGTRNPVRPTRLEAPETGVSRFPFNGEKQQASFAHLWESGPA